MTNYNIPSLEKYINPNTVNSQKTTRIFVNDPRNNPAFLSANPNVIVIDMPNDPDYENDSFLEEVDPSPNDNNDDDSNNNLIETPKNLAIKNFEAKLSNDGNVYYTATLTFDDVDFATDYEYVLEIA